MDRLENFFGWLWRRRGSQPPTENPIKPRGAPSYRPLDDLDTIITQLKEIQVDFDDMIASTDKVLKTLNNPRPYMTREFDNPKRLA